MEGMGVEKKLFGKQVDLGLKPWQQPDLKAIGEAFRVKTSFDESHCGKPDSR